MDRTGALRAADTDPPAGDERTSEFYFCEPYDVAVVVSIVDDQFTFPLSLAELGPNMSMAEAITTTGIPRPTSLFFFLRAEENKPQERDMLALPPPCVRMLFSVEMSLARARRLTASASGAASSGRSCGIRELDASRALTQVPRVRGKCDRLRSRECIPRDKRFGTGW